DVRLDRRARRARLGGAELELTAVVEAEQLVCIPMLLVVVDQARIRRRRHDAVEGPRVLDVASVGAQDRRLALAVADEPQPPDPGERVERIAAQEADRRLDRAAGPLVLVATVLGRLRSAGRLVIEVCGAARGPR